MLQNKEKGEIYMKRPMTLVAFIISTVFLGIDALLELIGLIEIINVAINWGASSLATSIIISILLFGVIVVAIVFNAISISAWNKNKDGFKKKKSKIITAIVFNFIVILFALIALIVGKGSSVAFFVLILFALVATNVLAFVDMGIEKNRIEKSDSQI